MSGTHAGGKKAAETNKRRYGGEFYQDIGRMGGQAGVGTERGFAKDRAYASAMGKRRWELHRQNNNSIKKSNKVLTFGGMSAMIKSTLNKGRQNG